ncbi:MAG: pyridoxal 5'-phosphate synthase glutaminase subunit PdxT [Acidobacteria bacterium]|nr:pyridoxal 5'-phosphate synthase glutaminase subunit PdxT [Acidobacteriota bacterium]MCB9396949.1 pyridoxal 5'-phosphate synthase glutaminase subunit PdxT [Acidobacteriota bacterium]
MIGVLAVQGGFQAHLKTIQKLGVAAREVRLAEDLDACSALILPGGESTTMLKLLKAFNLMDPLRQFCLNGDNQVLATCAGAILLAQKVVHPEQESLGVLPVTIERNAYGCQRESFEAPISVPAWQLVDQPVYFIRAPKFLALGPGVEVISSYEGDITGVSYRNLTAVTYHPELAEDPGFHQAWLQHNTQKVG